MSTGFFLGAFWAGLTAVGIYRSVTEYQNIIQFALLIDFVFAAFSGALLLWLLTTVKP